MTLLQVSPSMCSMSVSSWSNCNRVVCSCKTHLADRVCCEHRVAFTFLRRPHLEAEKLRGVDEEIESTPRTKLVHRVSHTLRSIQASRPCLPPKPKLKPVIAFALGPLKAATIPGGKNVAFSPAASSCGRPHDPHRSVYAQAPIVPSLF